jgi:hypothetical protein
MALAAFGIIGFPASLIGLVFVVAAIQQSRNQSIAAAGNTVQRPPIRPTETYESRTHSRLSQTPSIRETTPSPDPPSMPSGKATRGDGRTPDSTPNQPDQRPENSLPVHSPGTSTVSHSAADALSDRPKPIAPLTSTSRESAVNEITRPSGTAVEVVERPGRALDSRARSLTEDDITLLKIASVMYYHNKHFIAMDPATYASVRLKTAALVGREAIPARSTARSKLATLVLAKWFLIEQHQEAKKEWDELISRVPFEWRLGQFEALVKGLEVALTDRDFPSLAEMRAGPARRIESMAQSARKNVTKKTINQILGLQVVSKVAETVNESYGPELGQQDLTPRQVFKIEPQYDDDRGVVYPGSASPVYIRGPFLKVSYHGQEPITSLLLIGRMRTTGASATLTEQQVKSLQFTSAFAGGQDESMMEMVKSENYRNSMPKTSFCYVSRLEKGDVIRLPLGEFDTAKIKGATVAAYCDQGHIAETIVAFIRKGFQKSQRSSPRIHSAGQLRSPF